MIYNFHKDLSYCNIHIDSLEAPENVNSASLTIAITICDKDYKNLPILLKNIKDKITGHYEIIVVDNCVSHNVELPEDIIHIKNNENLYPFISRILAAEKATGNYIWYIDGDDNIISNINVDTYNQTEYGIILFSDSHILHDKEIISMPYKTFFEKGILDNTLHSVFINKGIYKQFCNFEKYKIWYFEDTLFLYYSLGCAQDILLCDDQIYFYNKSTGGQVYKNLTEEKTKELLVGYDKVIEFIYNYFSGEAQEYIFNMAGFLLNQKTNIPAIDKSLSAIKYIEYSNNLQVNDISNKLIDKCPNKNLDIIYIYYGKSYKNEIDNLKKACSDSTNIIILDYFGTAKSDETIDIKENLNKGFKTAREQIKSKNVLILESYKSFNIPKKFSKNTVIYSEGYKPNTRYNNPLARNNVIFSIKDFDEFIKNDTSLGSLSSDICNFLNKRSSEACNETITKALPFDESDITFFFFNFNDLLSRDYISQYCVNNVKETFPKSTINIFTEDSVKKYIKKSKLTQDLIEYRKTSMDMVTYENDILRLLISQDTPKSIYLDMDALITDKNTFLKNLSIYPNYCPVNFWKSNKVIFHNETMWTLGKSSFIEENLKYYESLTCQDIISASQSYWNGEISNNLLQTFKGSFNRNYIQLLDMAGYIGHNKCIHHFCGSRYKLTKNVLTVGLYSVPDTKILNASKEIIGLVRKSNCWYSYFVRMGSIAEGFFQEDISGIIHNSIETFIDFYNTQEILKRQLNNPNIKFVKITENNDPDVYSIVDSSDQIHSKRKYLAKVAKNYNTLNVIPLDFFGFYLNDYKKEDLDKMSKEQLKELLKQDILLKNNNIKFFN